MVERVGTRVATTVAGMAACALLAAAAAAPDTGMYARLGIPVAEPALRAIVPALRTAVQLGASLAVGALLLAAFLAAPQRSGVLDVDGYRAVRRAAWAAGGAGLGALALSAFSAADLSGAHLGEIGGLLANPDLLGTYAALEEPMAWLLTGAGLVVVAAGCWWCLTRRAAAWLAALAVASVLPPAAVGHAAGGAGHDWGTDAALLHAASAAVWTGMVAALLVHRGGAHTEAVWRRGRRLLDASGLVWLGSSVVLALVLAVPGSVTGTAWGGLLLAQAGLAVPLAAGWLLARRGPAPPPRATALLLGGSALVTVAAVAMTRTVPPRFLVRPDSPGEVLIGYDLDAPVSALRLLLDWRPNILFTVLTVVAACAYLRGVHVLRRRGDAWGRGRTAAWLAGCLVLLLATSSGVGRYSQGVFSVHMAGHMVVNMFAPVLLALGGPGTLALRAMRPAAGGTPDGPREWLAAAMASPVARAVSHPLVALPLFVGSPFALYFTGLLDTALRYHWAHQLMNLHFLAVGYLFFWPLVGVDRAPVRLPHLGRLGVLLAAMPFHAFFGIALMNSNALLGAEFYRSLALPWLPDLHADQWLAGGIAWATGELPMLVVTIALLVQWSREDARAAARHDRRAVLDDDAELRTYNAMLARLSRTGG